jgi:hypothetical protein
LIEPLLEVIDPPRGQGRISVWISVPAAPPASIM